MHKDCPGEVSEAKAPHEVPGHRLPVAKENVHPFSPPDKSIKS